jgi:hypothetical protein
MKRIISFALMMAITVSAGLELASANASAQTGDELLGYLPDANGVAVIDFQKITASAFWSTLSNEQKFKSTIEKAESEISDLGVKLADVRSLALAFQTGSMNPIVAITGSFDQSTVLERLKSNAKIKITSEKYKGFDLYKVNPAASNSSSNEQSTTKHPPLKSENAFVFHDSNTVIAGTLDGVRASIDVMSGGSSSVAQDRLLADALAENPSAAIRFALSVTPTMTGALQSSELPVPDFSSIKLIFGAVDVSSGLALNATLRNDTAEHAKSIAERLNGLLSMAKGYLGAAQNPKTAPIAGALNTVSIVSVDIDVKVTGSVPADLLSSLFASPAKN